MTTVAALNENTILPPKRQYLLHTMQYRFILFTFPTQLLTCCLPAERSARLHQGLHICKPFASATPRSRSRSRKAYKARGATNRAISPRLRLFSTRTDYYTPSHQPLLSTSEGLRNLQIRTRRYQASLPALHPLNIDYSSSLKPVRAEPKSGHQHTGNSQIC